MMNIMDICGKIFHTIETENIEFNNAIYDLILQEFLDIIDINVNFYDCETSESKVRSLKENYVYTSNYIEDFFGLLKKYNYNMKDELKDAMFCLGHLRDPNRNQTVIKKFLASPVIDDISFNGKNRFVISSEQYGEFSFEMASNYFKDNKRVTDYMEDNVLPNYCHSHAYFMSEVFKDYYAITSLCRYYFKGDYYHSYTYDNDRNVIFDFCYNSVMDKEAYYEIFQPQDISVILNSEVDNELNLTTLKTNQPVFRMSLLKIALYKQYLDSIGYKGSLEEAPCAKKYVKI